MKEVSTQDIELHTRRSSKNLFVKMQDFLDTDTMYAESKEFDCSLWTMIVLEKSLATDSYFQGPSC